MSKYDESVRAKNIFTPKQKSNPKKKKDSLNPSKGPTRILIIAKCDTIL